MHDESVYSVLMCDPYQKRPYEGDVDGGGDWDAIDVPFRILVSVAVECHSMTSNTLVTVKEIQSTGTGSYVRECGG